MTKALLFAGSLFVAAGCNAFEQNPDRTTVKIKDQVVIKPPADVLTSSVGLTVKARIPKIIKDLDGQLSVNRKVEKIRDALPPTVRAFEVLNYHLSVAVANGTLRAEKYVEFLAEILPKLATNAATATGLAKRTEWIRQSNELGKNETLRLKVPGARKKGDLIEVFLGFLAPRTDGHHQLYLRTKHPCGRWTGDPAINVHVANQSGFKICVLKLTEDAKELEFVATADTPGKIRQAVLRVRTP